MIATNADEAGNLTQETTLKVQKMRKRLAELPEPKWWQLGLILKRSWLEGKIEAEIDYAKRLQRWSDKIQTM